MSLDLLGNMHDDLDSQTCVIFFLTSAGVDIVLLHRLLRRFQCSSNAAGGFHAFFSQPLQFHEVLIPADLHLVCVLQVLRCVCC